MSSPGGSGSDAGTPVSERTPSPNPNAITKPGTPSKNETPKDLSPSSSGSRSGTSTPTLTPTTNGNQTPPNDSDIGDVSKSLKPGGSLKFFKDGVLCLELSHHDEGERTKWVQIRTKTVFPTVIYASKEVNIPCHLTPAAFSSPSNANNPRVESSTSHSMSDDGSSMLSSPRLRESAWKQPVPQKGVSTSLEFFMKPAPCVFKCRRKMQVKAHVTVRRPYVLPLSAVNVIQMHCSCDKLIVKKVTTSNGEVDDKIETEEGDKLVTKGVRTCNSSNKQTKCKFSLEILVKKLENLAESRCSVLKLKRANCNSNAPAGAPKTQSVTPKKRVFKEMEPRDPNFRPKKKSPIRNIEKTILTVPGLNSEFYKRHTGALAGLSGTNDLPSLPLSIPHGDGTGEGKCSVIVNHRTPHKHGKGHHASSSIINSSSICRNSPYLGAKSVSTCKSLLNTSELANNSLIFNPNHVVKTKSAISMSNSGSRASTSPISCNSTSKMKNKKISVQQQQEQQLFQQQTMSKAISYTINSLLGTGNNGSSSTSSSSSSRNGSNKSSTGSNNTTNESAQTKIKVTPKMINNAHNISTTTASKGGIFSVMENDQNSFLRHLLDTSDPIPSGKTERCAIIQTRQSPKSSSSSGSSSNHSGSSSVNNPTSIAIISKSSSLSSTPSHSIAKPVLSSSSSPPNHGIRHSSHSHPMLSTNTSPYSNLFRTQDNSSNAALAAAAAFHYSSLLPASFLPHLSNSAAAAAAAAAASYLVPHTPVVTSSSASAVPQHHYTNNNNNALNLSQRVWPGFIPGTSVPSPFHAALGEDFQSMTTAMQRRTGHSPYIGYNAGNRADKLIDASVVDNDAPLNLCKKPRPN